MARTLFGGACPTGARRLKAKEKQALALDLRKQGLTYSQIGEEMGVRKSTAHDYVSKALADLAKTCTEEAEQVRDIEIHRLDGLYLKALEALVRAEELAEQYRSRISASNDPALVKAWSSAERVILDAERRCLDVMERRAKLLGLDSAQKVEHSGAITWLDLYEVADGKDPNS